MQQLGLPISKSKLFPPAQIVPCLGININLVTGTLEVPQDKLALVHSKCIKWHTAVKATKNQLQSLVGSLIYIHKCVKAARLFVNRILDVLRAAPDRGYIMLDDGFRKDVSWFVKFLKRFNGSVYFFKQLVLPCNNLYLDASLTGIGGNWGSKVFACKIADLSHIGDHFTIVHFEMLNILVAMRLWKDSLANKSIILYCDNLAVVNVLQSGRGRDLDLLAMARNVWLETAQADIDLQVQHIPGKANVVADLLSRWYSAGTDRQQLYQLVNEPQWFKVEQHLSILDHNI